MSITTTAVSQQYTFSAGASAASYPIPFTYQDATEILATLTRPDGTNITLTEGTDYSVTAGPVSSGTLTKIGTWDSQATQLTVYRSTDKTNSVVLVNGGKLDADVLEQMVDRLTQIDQEVSDANDRSLVAPITDTSPPSALPTKDTRANNFLAFDSNGDPVAATGASGSPVSTAMAGFVDAASLGDAQNILQPVNNITTGAVDSSQTLPQASTVLDQVYTYNKADSGAGHVVVGLFSGDVFIGTTNTTITLYDQGDSVRLIAVTGGWQILSLPSMSISRLTQERAHPLGELSFIAGNYQSPAAIDPLDPTAGFPWLCLDLADTVITTTHWPLLVPYLRGLIAGYRDGATGSTTAFTLASYSLTSNVVTLTFASNAANTAILTDLAEDEAVQGSYTSWRTVTIPALGTIPAGTYWITNVTAGSLTITFAYTAADITSTSTTSTVNFYLYRLDDTETNASTSARVFAVKGRTLISHNDANDSVINGLRRRDYFQGHSTTILGSTNASTGSGNVLAATGSITTSNFSVADGTPVTDGTNGTPRTGKTTHSADIGAHLYLWGARYAA